MTGIEPSDPEGGLDRRKCAARSTSLGTTFKVDRQPGFGRNTSAECESKGREAARKTVLVAARSSVIAAHAKPEPAEELPAYARRTSVKTAAAARAGKAAAKPTSFGSGQHRRPS